jgi:DNA-directed RNA polymerase
MDSLVQQQMDLESYMVDEAVARQHRDLVQADKRKEGGASKVGSFYVKSLAPKLVESITSFVSPEKRIARQAVAAKLLKESGIESGVLAYLTTKAVMNSLGLSKHGQVKRVTLTAAIGEIVHDEWRMRYFSDKTNRKNLLRKLFKDFDKRMYPRHWRKRTVQNYFDAEQLDWQGWTDKQKKHVGFALLCIFRDQTGILVPNSKETKYSLSDAFVEHQAELVKRQAPLFTLYRPMVVPPHRWATNRLFRGGYISGKVKRYGIIKGMGRKDLTRIDNFDWDQILPAINALQETKWRVNSRMLEALVWAYDVHGGGIGKLVRSDPKPLPPEPPGYREDEEVTKRHNHICFLIHDENRQDKSRRIAALMTIGMARHFVKYDAIYFPHNLDSRGRAYPLPAFLNPQGPDYSKALLEFAEGVTIIDQAGANWLAIAGANAYGNDKVSLAERVQWVHDNEEMILSVSRDFRSDLSWTEASDPFQFLRFCFEWAGWRNTGSGYVSHMVVPVDATCSGLQHYAAMLRDEVGGKSVNLIPFLPRQDIYGDVASVVILKLLEDGSGMGRSLIDFGIDRKLTKRQVMVVPYAGKFSSCLSYTKEVVNEKLSTGVTPQWDIHDQSIHNEHCVLLAKLIWEAISEVVVKGKEAMQWLSKVASEYAKYANTLTEAEGFAKRMTWVTPDGFEVSHYEAELKKTQLKTYFDGHIQLVLYENTDKLSVKDMSLAVAPNFVHSLDACHLRMTIMRGVEIGLSSFGMVHDSFGVHAGHMPRFLSDCVKPAFIQMYTEHDVLQELADRYASVVATPPLPAKGTLVLEDVAKSEFFFS